MMTCNFYLSLFPAEALIASQLEPEAFGAYMAIGARRGSAERLIFAEIEPEFGDDFDWQYAQKHCVAHPDGTTKNSVYLSVYRVLEQIPINKIKALYLTTRDGRSLKLDPRRYEAPAEPPPHFIYQELCPVTPLVVSKFAPGPFATSMTNASNKVYVPCLFFADLKVLNAENPVTGNLGALYDRNVRHLQFCIDSVMASDKTGKTINRSHSESFSFQVIGNGLYIGGGDKLVMFPMPSVEALKQQNYYWARSALII